MSIIKRLGLIGVVAASAAALGGCYDDYGYGGVAVGYGPGVAGYDGYYDGFYGDGGYYPGYYGWYGGYYYPGTGVYVYDRYHHPFRWNGTQRNYWMNQRHGWRGGPGGGGFRPGANWGGFNHGGGRAPGQAFRGPGGGHFGGGHFGGHGGGGHHR